ncbi:hypothetical protein ACGFZQ_39270 [Streptomyces sp. NPDC048254]|uniref:hypothetical protein n=1 Tax=Streptomyces sp. NPDC048254 TaxID=3365525 RepID=UPI003712C04A
MKHRNLLRGVLAAGLTAQALAAPRTDTNQTLSPNGSQDLADLVTDFMTLRPLLTAPQPAPSGTGCAGRTGRWPG